MNDSLYNPQSLRGLDGCERQGHFLQRTLSVGNINGDTRQQGGNDCSSNIWRASFGHVHPWRLSIVGWTAPVFQRDEIRYTFRNERSDATRLEPNTVGSLPRDNRIARYFKGRPRRVLSFRWSTQKENTLNVGVDSDRAGCPNTRCSTSGGVLMIGEYPLRRWSVTHATVSLRRAWKASTPIICLRPHK